MTRGRPPQHALDAALPIAQSRGPLMEFLDDAPLECDFKILGRDRFIVAAVKRIRNLWRTPEEIVAQCTEAIEQLRSAPAYLSREIWFWCPHGTFRFFRVEQNCIVELDVEGNVLTVLKPDKKPEKRPGKKPEKEAPDKFPEKAPENAAEKLPGKEPDAEPEKVPGKSTGKKSGDRTR